MQTGNTYTSPEEEAVKTLAGQYKQLETYRTVYTQRAEAAAQITIPHLFQKQVLTMQLSLIHLINLSVLMV